MLCDKMFPLILFTLVISDEFLSFRTGDWFEKAEKFQYWACPTPEMDLQFLWLGVFVLS